LYSITGKPARPAARIDNLALAALLYGLGILHFGGNGWNLLGLIGLIGTIAFWYLPEMFGKISEGSCRRRQSSLSHSFLFARNPVTIADNRPFRAWLSLDNRTIVLYSTIVL